MELNFFSLQKTLECGQVFRYKKCQENNYLVFSENKACHAYLKNNRIVLETDSPEYFLHYFDAETDYLHIEERLLRFPECADAVNFGRGIHILNQDLYETVISFILSANNNIPRIQGILERLCLAFGQENEMTYTVNGVKKTEKYRAFPTPEVMAKLNESDFRALGCGYRAKYLASTAASLLNSALLSELPKLTTHAAEEELNKLKGIGPKVLDCILLFGLRRTERYPVDTWVFKKSRTDCLNTPQKVRDYYSARYGGLAGYAQQYVFYYGRAGF